MYSIKLKTILFVPAFKDKETVTNAMKMSNILTVAVNTLVTGRNKQKAQEGHVTHWV